MITLGPAMKTPPSRPSPPPDAGLHEPARLPVGEAPPAARNLLYPASTQEILRLPRRPVAAVLENLRSLWNVGSIFRTSDAVRLQELYLCGFTGHPPRREIDKTALGATESVPWSYWSSSLEAIRWLKESGFTILGLERNHDSRPLREIEVRSPVAFVVGNEIAGVSEEALELCDATVEIPMAGMKESLNVAVAFGVMAYDLAARIPIPEEAVRDSPGAGGRSPGRREYPMRGAG